MTKTTTTVKVPARVTFAWLKRRGACDDQAERFMATFPDGAAVTAENVRRAAEVGLNIDWFAHAVLGRDAPARRAYGEATAPARRAYGEATAPARRAYGEATAPALITALGLEGGGTP